MLQIQGTVVSAGQITRNWVDRETKKSMTRDAYIVTMIGAEPGQIANISYDSDKPPTVQVGALMALTVRTATMDKGVISAYG